MSSGGSESTAAATTAATTATTTTRRPSSPPLSVYTPPSILTPLTQACTDALVKACADATASLSPVQRAELKAEFVVEATKAALRAVLTQHFDADVAAACSATFSQSSVPATVEGSPLNVGQNALYPSSPAASADDATASTSTSTANGNTPSAVPRKPIRTYIDGCFDIMHSGHYNAIRQAKALTDILVVGVHSDAEILRHKGPPVMNEQERLATVRACKWVDEVVFDTPYDPSLELLIKLNCDFCVHGDDLSTTADGRDAYADVKAAGRMKVVKRTEGVSTTDLVGRLLLMTKSHHINSPALKPVPSSAAAAAEVESGDNASAPPVLALGAPAAGTSAGAGTATPPRKSSNVGSSSGVPPRAPSSASPASVTSPADSISSSSSSSSSSYPSHSSRPSQHYSSGISNFLPTTWRLTQFSNHRTPKPEDKIVYIDGAFDLFHVGHIETLKKAKELGTFLYVGIHDDATVNRHKGKNFPAMNLHERVLNVLSCKYVDEVVIGAPWCVSSDLITTLNIHVVASGSNTKMDASVEEALKHSGGVDVCADCYTIPKSLGIFTQIETTHSLTTDDVVHRLIENRLKYEKRNAKRSVKELNYLKGQKQYVAEI